MKLNVKKVFYVGLAFFLIQIFWQIYDTILPKILMDKFGMGHTLSGFVMAFDNILALTLLPLFGALSDRTNHKRGRRTPYIIVGTVVAVFAFFGLTFLDNLQLQLIQEAGVITTFEQYQAALAAGATMSLEQINILRSAAWDVTVNNPTIIIIFSFVLLIVLVAMSSFRSPAVALMPDVTVKPLRSKANAIINFMGGVSGALALVISLVMSVDAVRNRYMNYSLLFGIVASIMIISLIVFLIKVKEPKLVAEMQEESIKYKIVDEAEVETGNQKMAPEKLRSLILILSSIFLWFTGYNAVTSKFSIYAQDVLSMGYIIPLLIAQASAILAFIPVGIISTKIGRKKMIMIGIVTLTVAFGSAFFLTASSSFLMYFILLLAGIGWASINVNSYPMIVELSKGSTVGKYTGYYYTFSMAAQALTPIMSGALMEFISPRILFPYGTFFVLAAFFTMMMVKHGDSKPVPTESKLEYLNVED